MAVITRRRLLVAGAAGAGLVLAWGVWPRDYDSDPQWNELRDDDGELTGRREAVFNAWLRIAENGSVLVAIPQCEMGQGVTTVLAQVIAEELGADWRTIATLMVPPEPVFANRLLLGKWAPMVLPASLEWSPDADSILLSRYIELRNFSLTAEDTEIPAYERSVREAAAMARVMLCKAAAARWDVDWESCEARDGFVVQGNNQIRFAELLEDALEQDVPDPVPLRVSQPGDIRTEPIGDAPPFARLDLPAKVDGSANFAADIRLPDMVYAAIRQGPPGDSQLKSVDTAPAAKTAGLIEIVRNRRWIATVATNWWAANQALGKLKPVFTSHGRLADSDWIDEQLEQALTKGKGMRFFSQGDVDAALAGQKPHVSHYQLGAEMHATIETSSATARYRDGQLELWLASQSPGDAIARAADALGIAEARVHYYPMMAGGSFDRRLDNEIAAQVALLARHMQRPVQLIWSRGEEMVHDPVRTPVRASIAGLADVSGRLVAMRSKIASAPTAREFGQRLFMRKSPWSAQRNVRGEPDRLAVAGAVPPYELTDWAVDHHPADIGIITGRWRSNAHSYGCFITETFIDEMAEKAGREPMSYRMQMLANDVRLARCLTRVATLGEWDGGLNNSGMGVACCAMEGGYIAVLAKARRQGSASGLRVDKLSAVVDAGRIINRDIALQQIEGGMIFGLAMAMGTTTGFEKGMATARRLRDLALPRLSQSPEIEVEFIDSQEAPAGLGGLGVPAVAPAIANALHSATGLRIRQLPLISGGL